MRQTYHIAAFENPNAAGQVFFNAAPENHAWILNQVIADEGRLPLSQNPFPLLARGTVEIDYDGTEPRFYHAILAFEKPGQPRFFVGLSPEEAFVRYMGDFRGDFERDHYAGEFMLIPSDLAF